MHSLYLTVEDAAKYVGIGVNAMRAYVNGADPPPLLRVGKKVLLEREGLAPYFKERQEVKR